MGRGRRLVKEARYRLRGSSADLGTSTCLGCGQKEKRKKKKKKEAEIGVDGSTNQEKPKVANNHQNLEELRKDSPCLEREPGSADTEIFGLLASRTVGDYISVVLSHPVHGASL